MEEWIVGCRFCYSVNEMPAWEVPGDSVISRFFSVDFDLIRNGADLHRIRSCIANNPVQWIIDGRTRENT